MSALDTMTPRQLLMVLCSMGHQVTAAREGHVVAPAKGPRGTARRAKRRRHATNMARKRRNSWRSYHAEEKRRAGAEA